MVHAKNFYRSTSGLKYDVTTVLRNLNFAPESKVTIHYQ